MLYLKIKPTRGDTFLQGASDPLGIRSNPFHDLTSAGDIPMSKPLPPSPAILWFLERHPGSIVFGQVRIERLENGFCLRSTADKDQSVGSLREYSVTGMRELAQFNAAGDFRPLKSAPDLRVGWVCFVEDARQLEETLDRLYPGGVVDAWAARVKPPPVTHYREFVGRQTGMYRVAQQLSDAGVAEVIRATCDSRHCLKRRFWKVEGLAGDPSDATSDIACLEPCAVLLECARRAARLAQEECISMGLVEGDRAVLMAALEQTLSHPAPGVRAGDLGHPLNPRRICLVLEKLRRTPGLPPSTAS